MSYCRFENTYSDFNDCLNALEEDIFKISPSEMKWARRLYEKCQEYIEVWEGLEEEFENEGSENMGENDR